MTVLDASQFWAKTDEFGGFTYLFLWFKGICIAAFLQGLKSYRARPFWQFQLMNVWERALNKEVHIEMCAKCNGLMLLAGNHN